MKIETVKMGLKITPALGLALAGTFFGALPSTAWDNATNKAALERARLAMKRVYGLGQAPSQHEAELARRALQRFIQEGRKQPFLAQETTKLANGRVSQQIVKHLGQGHRRIEYLSPPGMRDEVLLIAGGRLYKYVPRQNKIFEGPAPGDDLSLRGVAILRSIDQGRIVARFVGRETVADQLAGVVEVHTAFGKEFYRRIWIDEKTGVRLKIENYDGRGALISTSSVTSIDYNPHLDAADFKPASLPEVPHELLLPNRPVSTIADVEAKAGFSARQPNVPEGFTLQGAWLVQGPGKGRGIALRFSDGVSAFTVFQRPASRNGRAEGRLRNVNGGYNWFSRGTEFHLVGQLGPEGVQQVYGSLR